MPDPGDQLRQQLTRNQELGEFLDRSEAPVAELQELQRWQRLRLASTYQDILAQERYQAAGHFFLEELYGGLDFRERDREVEQVAPVMIRLLPRNALLTLAEAFELQAVSLELDLVVAEIMRQRGTAALRGDSYAEAYRAAGEDESRERQIELIRKLGTDLGELVRKPLLLQLVRLMRVPAKRAGFGRLQAFLEEGLDAFTAMGDAQPFVHCVYQREREFRKQMLAGASGPDITTA